MSTEQEMYETLHGAASSSAANTPKPIRRKGSAQSKQDAIAQKQGTGIVTAQAAMAELAIKKADTDSVAYLETYMARLSDNIAKIDEYQGKLFRSQIEIVSLSGRCDSSAYIQDAEAFEIPDVGNFGSIALNAAVDNRLLGAGIDTDAAGFAR